MSDEVERRIVALLKPPMTCPHGNPIPGLDELTPPPVCTTPEPSDVTHDVAGLVEKNAMALSLLSQGFAYPCHSPQQRDMEAPLPPYSKFRNLTRLLVLSGYLHQSRHELGAAMRTGGTRTTSPPASRVSAAARPLFTRTSPERMIR